MGGIPAPLGYEGFPKSVCTSINDQVCHGIPSADVVLKDGDIINVDVSTIYHGYYADSSAMFCIGNVSPNIKTGGRCQRVRGIRSGAGKTVGLHGRWRKRSRSMRKKMVILWFERSAVTALVMKFHEDPWLAILVRERHRHDVCTGHDVHDQPMINEGTEEVFVDGDDDWSVYTKDGKASAQ